MRMPQDRVARTNLYFLSGLVAVGLVFASVVFAMSVYKHAKYGSFELVVRGQETLQYDPVWQTTTTTETPTSAHNDVFTYRRLRDLAWGHTEPAYRLGGQSGLWFTATPDRNGDFILASAADGTPFADVGLQMRNLRGHTVSKLVPGQWYQVKQYGRWFTLRLFWDP
ncbi:hypothetical protein [Alicyclobacillus sp. ALC3]|uniref:hypothetical protein n=1 Tax=Alicyclobacillus sp. ALC3 TaxID=2796143 RepID=UPI002378458B|nr:hypothetical protein [Alicyclobacillus sp. ALC3]WDL98029.1 hypothetical protein JC200_04800 [Alicyclobacillus sp. ALC3]